MDFLAPTLGEHVLATVRHYTDASTRPMLLAMSLDPSVVALCTGGEVHASRLGDEDARAGALSSLWAYLSERTQRVAFRPIPWQKYFDGQ